MLLKEDILHNIRSDCLVNITLTQKESKRFFKTFPGGYAEKDKFLGVRVPHLRKIAKKYYNVELNIIQNLLESPYNEERLIALIVLAERYSKTDFKSQELIFQFYIRNLTYVNNWNLVDSSAHLILGCHLMDKDRNVLYNLSKSRIVWERRASIVSTWYFIRNGDNSTTFQVAELLLEDSHELIHKAVGWMLREAGKRNQEELVAFLSSHGRRMPKIMLRYAKEKLNLDR
jgi:3-methyladenine DNA glycosylase AlkD